MLTMTPHTSAAGLKAYYTRSLRGEYYSHDSERAARWHGQAAERLGIGGADVTREVFGSLSDNRRPDGEARLTQRTRGNRTLAYDLTFSAPKGVSMLHALHRDERIIECVQAAAGDTMREIERQAMTRVRARGQDADRITGNLLWGQFTHTTTRPVDSVPDPHLHVHCVAFNVTWDGVEGRFKAGQFREIKRDAPYYQAAFDARLARRMNEIGYATERSAKGWDLAGIPESVREKFSRRTRQIEERAAELGMTDPAEKAMLGAKTRESKIKSLDRKTLQAQWLSRLTKVERSAVEAAARKRADSRDQSITARQALDRAIGHMFERESVVSFPRLLEAALIQGVGQTTPEQIEREAARDRELLRATVGNERLVTTRQAVAEERAMLAFAREGRGRCSPLEADQPWNGPKASLNDGQRAAVEHVLKTTDRVMLIRGGAGTGKTTLMREAVAAIERRGRAVTVVAPTSQASRGVLRESGFAAADTLQMLLSNRDLQANCKGGVILCDEAGLVATRDMRALFDLARTSNARVILVGDSKQHAPVQRGDALRLLESHAGLKAAQVTAVVRQSGRYRGAVEALGRGEFDKGVRSLDRLNAIHEIADNLRPVEVARDYCGTVRAGRSCVVVAPTHAEGEQITDLIRAELKRSGTLGPSERVVPRHRDLNWTEGQKQDPARYGAGHVVRFQRRVGAFKGGEPYRVLRRDKNGRVLVQGLGPRDRPRALPLNKSASFAVFEEGLLRLAAGDQVRFTRNGRSHGEKHRLDNGSVHRVAGFTKDGHIRLKNGRVVSRDYAHLAHAYCSTSHAAQGRTADRVILSQPWSTVAAASAEQMYVSVSRGRHSVAIYTDDRQALVESISRLGQRRSAIEIVDRSKADVRLARLNEHAISMQRLRKYEQTRSRLRGRRGRGIFRGFTLGR